MIDRVREDQIPADNAAGYTSVGLYARGTVPTEPQLMLKAIVRVPHPHPMPANCLAIEVDDPEDSDTRERVRATISKLWKLG